MSVKDMCEKVAAIAGEPPPFSADFWEHLEACMTELQQLSSTLPARYDGRVAGLAFFQFGIGTWQMMGLSPELMVKLDALGFEVMQFFAGRDQARLAMGGKGGTA